MSTDERKLASCSDCPARWGGRKTCHCPTCHRTFTGLTAFDHHGPGRCRHLEGDPPGLVVVRQSGNQQVWGMPDSGGRWGEAEHVPAAPAVLTPDVRDLLEQVTRMARAARSDDEEVPA